MLDLILKKISYILNTINTSDQNNANVRIGLLFWDIADPLNELMTLTNYIYDKNSSFKRQN